MPDLPFRYGVVVPTYNGARFLPRCLAAVFAQTLPPAEVVVVDDASTDDPAAVVAALGLPVRVVRHPVNRGLPATRNTGIQALNTEFVALLDCDDEWRPGKLAAQMALFAAAPDLDLVYADFAHRHPDGSPAPWQGGLVARHRRWGVPLDPVGDCGYRHGSGVHEWLLAKTSFIHPSAAVVRRAALERVGGFDETLRHMEDLDLWVRLGLAGRFGLVDAVAVDVDQRPDSLGHRLVPAAEHLLRLYAAAADRYPPLPPALAAEVTDRVAQTHFDLGWEYGRAGDAPGSRRHLREAVKLRPTWRNRVALWKAYCRPAVARYFGR